MNPISIAWAAGLLEGEGCFSIFHRKTAKHDFKTVAIHCEMTDEDTVQKIYSVFNVGTVILRPNVSGRQDRRDRKPTWIWSVQNQAGVLLVCEAILPHMGERRSKKILELLEYVKSKINLDNS